MPHIAANDPAATLRRCAAYRAIMDAAVKAFSYDATYDNIVCGEQNAYDVTLRALASIYADADGYDPSWRL
jgi:xanthine dehydrogenase iron-sulfur cluster and FAD-binding subunit A